MPQNPTSPVSKEWRNIPIFFGLTVFTFLTQIHSKLCEKLHVASDIYCLIIATTKSLTGNENYYC